MRDVKVFIRWPERLALAEVAERLGVTEEQALRLAIKRLVLDVIAGQVNDRAGDESEALRPNGCQGGCCND